MGWKSSLDIADYECKIGLRRICWAKNFFWLAIIIFLFTGADRYHYGIWLCLWASVLLYSLGTKIQLKIKNPVDSEKFTVTMKKKLHKDIKNA
jgi:hypothetical protein